MIRNDTSGNLDNNQQIFSVVTTVISAAAIVSFYITAHYSKFENILPKELLDIENKEVLGSARNEIDKIIEEDLRIKDLTIRRNNRLDLIGLTMLTLFLIVY